LSFFTAAELTSLALCASSLERRAFFALRREEGPDEVGRCKMQRPMIQSRLSTMPMKRGIFVSVSRRR